MNTSRAVLTIALLVNPASAQDDLAPHAEESCCSEAASGELPPLPEDATAKERRLRELHEQAGMDPANVYLSQRYVDDYRARLAACADDAPLADRFGLRYALALFLVRTGELDEAIRLNEECLALAEAHPDEARAWMPETLFRLAAAHFRLAERDNCIARHTADSCIFPLQGGAVHVERRGAEQASRVLERLLATEGSDLDLEARWLLNIAHMALGSHPGGVPAEHRIGPERFAPEAPAPRFIDRARGLGLAHHTHAGSVVMDDFTGDGRLDLFTCAFDTGSPVRLCRNEGDGTFTDVTEEAGLSRQLGGIHATQADVDGDGRLDLLVVRGGGFFSGAEMPGSLLHQDRPGHFTDVTREAGVEVEAPSRAACFADVDVDGDVDLFIGYETEVMGDTVKHPSRLWRNDGPLRFTEVTAESGIATRARCTGAVFGDVDVDGDPDLFLTQWLAPNLLYRNEGHGAFREVAAEAGVDRPESSAPAALLDADQDGDLDLFVGYQHHYRPIRAVAQWYLHGTVEGPGQRLFENLGGGTFRDVTEPCGLRRACYASGLNAGDIDQDGRPDLYLATGSHDLAALFPNVFLLNGERFRDATFAAGVGHLQKGNGVALGDLDDDGDLDIALQVGGFYPDDGFGDVLFENPGFGRRFIAVDLRATRGETFGLGARIRIQVRDADGATRDVYHVVGPGGSTGSNPRRATLGLADAQEIAFIEVAWPGAPEVQRITGVPLDAAIRITQDADGFERLERAPLRLAR